MRYAARDFDRVPSGEAKFYCPGCNRYPEDAELPSVGCPCDTHGEGRGVLTAEQVDGYLTEQWGLSTASLRDERK